MPHSGMKGGKFRWFGDKFKSAYRKEMEERLSTVGEIVKSEAMKRLRKPYPPASKLGESPHTRRYMQGLLGSVFWQLVSKPLSVIVGTNMFHGLYHETHGRPWLMPAFEKVRDRVKAIMSKPLPGSGGGGEKHEGGEE